MAGHEEYQPRGVSEAGPIRRGRAARGRKAAPYDRQQQRANAAAPLQQSSDAAAAASTASPGWGSFAKSLASTPFKAAAYAKGLVFGSSPRPRQTETNGDTAAGSDRTVASEPSSSDGPALAADGPYVNGDAQLQHSPGESELRSSNMAVIAQPEQAEIDSAVSPQRPQGGRRPPDAAACALPATEGAAADASTETPFDNVLAVLERIRRRQTLPGNTQSQRQPVFGSPAPSAAAVSSHQPRINGRQPGLMTPRGASQQLAPFSAPRPSALQPPDGSGSPTSTAPAGSRLHQPSNLFGQMAGTPVGSARFGRRLGGFGGTPLPRRSVGGMAGAAGDAAAAVPSPLPHRQGRPTAAQQRSWTPMRAPDSAAGSLTGAKRGRGDSDEPADDVAALPLIGSGWDGTSSSAKRQRPSERRPWRASASSLQPQTLALEAAPTAEPPQPVSTTAARRILMALETMSQAPPAASQPPAGAPLPPPTAFLGTPPTRPEPAAEPSAKRVQRASEPLALEAQTPQPAQPASQPAAPKLANKPVACGWGDAFLTQNAASSAAASKAVQEELEKATGGAAKAAATSAPAAKTPAPSAAPAAEPVSKPTATGGWGDLLKQNASQAAVAAKAVQDEIDKAAGGGGGASSSAAAPSFSFGVPAASETLDTAAAPEPAAKPPMFGAAATASQPATRPPATLADSTNSFTAPSFRFGSKPAGGKAKKVAKLSARLSADKALSPSSRTFRFGLPLEERSTSSSPPGSPAQPAAQASPFSSANQAAAAAAQIPLPDEDSDEPPAETAAPSTSESAGSQLFSTAPAASAGERDKSAGPSFNFTRSQPAENGKISSGPAAGTSGSLFLGSSAAVAPALVPPSLLPTSSAPFTFGAQAADKETKAEAEAHAASDHKPAASAAPSAFGFGSSAAAAPGVGIGSSSAATPSFSFGSTPAQTGTAAASSAAPAASGAAVASSGAAPLSFAFGALSSVAASRAATAAPILFNFDGSAASIIAPLSAPAASAAPAPLAFGAATSQPAASAAAVPSSAPPLAFAFGSNAAAGFAAAASQPAETLQRTSSIGGQSAISMTSVENGNGSGSVEAASQPAVASSFAAWGSTQGAGFSFGQSSTPTISSGLGGAPATTPATPPAPSGAAAASTGLGAPAGTPAFGSTAFAAPASQPAAGSAGSGLFGCFGAASAPSAMGSPAAAPSSFAGGFGSSSAMSFGAAGTPVFGGASTAAPFAFGSGGGASSTPAASAPAFGAPAPAFGGAQGSQPGFQFGGNAAPAFGAPNSDNSQTLPAFTSTNLGAAAGALQPTATFGGAPLGLAQSGMTLGSTPGEGQVAARRKVMRVKRPTRR